MSKYRDAALITACAGLMAGAAFADGFGLGRPATPDEIAAWDLDVRPDGTGLPPGSGSVEDGEGIFADRCASCHGDFAEGVDNWPKLAGGFDTLDHEDPVKTVGSYWPHLSTAWDYVNRSMPFGEAQSLETDEVYAIIAYILYSNDLVAEDFVLSDKTFFEVEMPNADGFIVDDRETAELSVFSGDPCMQNCKTSVEITMRAAVLDVTPDTRETATGDTNADEPSADAPATPDPERVAAGEKVFRKCKACHQIGEGAKMRTGPVLTGIVGAPAGAADGFKYSGALRDAAASGLVWTKDNLGAFLRKPKEFMAGTKMSFAGLRKEDDVAAIIAYLAAHPGS